MHQLLQLQQMLPTKLASVYTWANITLVDVATATPTDADLAPYHAVLVYSDTCFANGALLGDALARYIAQGGGVVLAGHSFALPAQTNSNSDNTTAGNATSPPAPSAFAVPACQTLGGLLRGGAVPTCAVTDATCGSIRSRGFRRSVTSTRHRHRHHRFHA